MDAPSKPTPPCGGVLSRVIQEVMETGQRRALTQEEVRQFHAEFAAGIGPEIETMRAQQRVLAGECRDLVVR